MSYSLEDLSTPLTVGEIKQSMYDVLTIVGVTTTNWKPGAVVRTIITAAAIILAGLSMLIAIAVRSGFLSTSEGEWTTVGAREGYGVTRIEATFATGELTLVNSGGGIYNADPEDLQFLNSVTEKTYRNTATVVLGAFGTVTIAIRADEAGADSTAAAGEIDEMVTTWLGVSCSNALAVVGQDEETDEALKARSLDRLGALSPNGPKDAYRFVASSATRPDGTAIGVTRVRTIPDEIGGLDVYLATATGAIVSGDVTIVDEALQLQCAPIPITLRTHSATAVPVAVTYEIWASNTLGLTSAQMQDAIEDELIAFFASEPIGGHQIGVSSLLSQSAIEAVIGRARTATGQSLLIYRVELAAPAGDVVLNASDVPTLGTVTGTINLAAPYG